MENYSRSNKKKTAGTAADRQPTGSPKSATQHIKKGFSAFQKTVATIGSLLGIIISCITIMSLLNKNKTETPKTPSTSTTTIIREVEKSGDNTKSQTADQTDSSSQTNTSSSSATDDNSNTNTTSQSSSSTAASNQTITDDNTTSSSSSQ